MKSSKEEKAIHIYVGNNNDSPIPSKSLEAIGLSTDPGVVLNPRDLRRQEVRLQGVNYIISGPEVMPYLEELYPKEVRLRKTFSATIEFEAVPDLMVFLSKNVK